MTEPDAFDLEPPVLQRRFEDGQSLYGRELEDYFLRRVLAPARTWRRDYSSVPAYLKSVESHRQRWHDILGRFEGEAVTGALVHTWPFHEEDAYRAEWVEFEFLPGVVSRAVVAVPKGASDPPPVVIFQHGIDSAAFRPFGLLDLRGQYWAAAHHLARAGFAVVVPVNKTGRPERTRLERIARLGGVSLFGLECYKAQRLIDWLQTRSDLNHRRLAYAGLSLGGLATQFLTPIEPRIRAAVSIGWFNQRPTKLVVGDPRYSCFLEAQETHIFLTGWLPEFGDADQVSLICPRPLMIQHGKADGIAWWPLVVAEFQKAREHYHRLGLGERIELVLHEGGHEVVYPALETFLRRWLVERTDQL